MTDQTNHSPENTFATDFLSIGFEGGVKMYQQAMAEMYPDLDLSGIDAAALRQRWAEEVGEQVKLESFNRHHDGAWMLSHAWAYRWIAYIFQDHMEQIGAEHYVAQEIEITPRLAVTGLKRMVILVMTGSYWNAIKQVVKDAAGAAAKERL